MTRKRRRMYVLLACGLGLGSAAALTLSALSQSMVYFMSPSDLAQKELAKSGGASRTLRVGGLVEAGSLRRTVEAGHPLSHFRLTDGAASVEVTFSGILPDLLREGQGAVTLGTLQPDGSFRAQEVLAKHDETYMPSDVADALKRAGRWKPGEGAPPPAATWNTLTPPAPARVGS